MLIRLIAAIPLFLPAAGAAGSGNYPKLRLTVKPSEAIETRVREEIRKGEDVLNALAPDDLFSSPYLVSAIYYHEGFLDDYPADRPDANPSRRIIGRLSRLLTPELKSRYIRMLGEIHTFSAGAPQFVLPVPYNPARKRRRRSNHKYAIDLFAHEGTPVRSATRGIVVLAEGNWRKDDPFSTSSQEGGNTIIIFDPGSKRFYRYCHLGAVLVRAGVPVDAGQTIGAVGHSGVNASRRGHGGHLHFEVNEYNGRAVRSLTYTQLSALITSARRQTAAGGQGYPVGVHTGRNLLRHSPRNRLHVRRPLDLGPGIRVSCGACVPGARATSTPCMRYPATHIGAQQPV